jgi:hypothetical protein
VLTSWIRRAVIDDFFGGRKHPTQPFATGHNNNSAPTPATPSNTSSTTAVIARVPIRILASQPKAPSKEDDKLGHGVFSYFLVNGLQARAGATADTNRDNQVSFDEILAAIDARPEDLQCGVHIPLYIHPRGTADPAQE